MREGGWGVGRGVGEGVGMRTHGCMPSLKSTTALKPLDLIELIQAASQTGPVDAER